MFGWWVVKQVSEWVNDGLLVARRDKKTYPRGGQELGHHNVCRVEGHFPKVKRSLRARRGSCLQAGARLLHL